MDIRLPTPKSAARILREALGEKSLTITHTQALDVVARLYGYNDWHSMNQDARFVAPAALKARGSNAYEFSDEPGSQCWIQAGPVSIRLGANERGIGVALYAKGFEEQDALSDAFVSREEAKSDPTKPDPTKPFFGCSLPSDIAALEFVSSDERARGWSKRREVTHTVGPILEWLEQGAQNSEADFSEDVLDYEGDHGSESLCAGDLFYAALSPDGWFELKDGREFYLIDEDQRRWAPTRRVVRN